MIIWQSDSPTRMALELEWKEEENVKLREENEKLRGERHRIAEWIRTTSRARGVLISIHSSQDLARVADAIEQGEHER